MIPLFVDLRAKHVVIFGGGEVAGRKAAYFAHEADVAVFSRSFSKKIAALPVKRKNIDVADASDKELGDIVKGADICIAALSDTGQNNRIGRICRQKKILFNNADGESGDIIIPSVIRGKQYQIAISTDGKSPAVTRFIREDLETRWANLDAMIKLQEQLRKRLKKIEPSQNRRSEILKEVLDDHDVWDALSRSKKEAEQLVNRRYLNE
ncbi:MAG: bifunctional precorrin-2 dehydrogenase/sirohydrochlorin ferrochelatase [Methanoregula sp.]|nr:MAG: bifunctional precorrin-2 dehydrogenase/sirohydrochlorin ferrochelatase [Methanoregula sp.]